MGVCVCVCYQFVFPIQNFAMKNSEYNISFTHHSNKKNTICTIQKNLVLVVECIGLTCNFVSEYQNS